MDSKELDTKKAKSRHSGAVDRAVELYKNGLPNAAIARELGVHSATVRNWFRQLGIPAKKASNSLTKNHQEEKDELAEKLSENLKEVMTSAAVEAKYEAAVAEEDSIMEIAEAQSTPADKYQHYIAAAGIRLLRDSMKHLRGPKSIRELSELDQIIRRNLGLNAKTGGGNGRLQIDISILNNNSADKGNGSVDTIRKTDKVIDAETGDELV